MIELKHVSKSYRQSDTLIEVLKDINLTIASGEKVAIIGASGSGKSTLLSLMSGMDIPDSGSVLIDGNDIAKMGENKLSQLRNTNIGVIFQSFELVPSFSALENVMLPLDIGGKESRAIAVQALTSVGLSSRMNHLPSMLSGGEEQRVAIARALVQSPSILFADEPTGNLDAQTGEQILAQLMDVAKDRTLVIITHDKEIADRMDRIIEIKGGNINEAAS